MDLFKLDKYDKYFVAFILIIITLFNIGQCFASEIEQLDFSIVNGIRIKTDTNYFVSADSYNVGYLEMEKGYIYHIYKDPGGTVSAPIALSNSSPAVNVTYNYIASVNPGESYSYIPNGDDYLIISFNTNSNGSTITVTREKIEGMNDAIGGLVNNVGVNQLWNVFEGGIDFVGVVVLVAFGLFLVFLLIKKLSKGKADF